MSLPINIEINKEMRNVIIEQKDQHENSNILSSEIISYIFSWLNLNDSITVSLVNKKWRKSAISPQKLAAIKKVYLEQAFGSDKWMSYFNFNVQGQEEQIIKNLDTKGEFSSFPLNVIEMLQSPCPAYPGMEVGKTHLLVWIPKTINNEPLTVTSFGKLVNKFYLTNRPRASSPYETRWFSMAETFDKPLERSYWGLVTRDTLENSHGKAYPIQKSLVKNLKGASTDYEVPQVMEAIVALFADYLKCDGYKEDQYLCAHTTRCEGRMGENQVILTEGVCGTTFLAMDEPDSVLQTGVMAICRLK